MPTYRDASIVVIGSFNPAIFHPEWLRKHDLLPEFELENAVQTSNALVVHSEISVLTFKSLRLEVQRERWTLTTERFDWAGDLGMLAASMLGKLPETPVKAVGFNLNQHRPIREELLAVLKRWGPLSALGELAGSNVAPMPCVQADWEGFRVTVQLQPSLRHPGALWIGQNYERHDFANVSELETVLGVDWPRALARANSLADRIVGEDPSS
jgi:hypothetical protein